MNYTTNPYLMYSGQAEAVNKRYHIYLGKSGRRWLVAESPTAGENIYLEDKNPNSQGFGGATLTFELTDGTEISLKGPWHSNADSLYNDTGVDVRNTFTTFCVIAKGRKTVGEYGSQTEYTDVLYIDASPSIGDFDRKEIEQMAQDFADKLEHSVYFYKETKGGSCCTPINPTGSKRYIAQNESRQS